MRGLGTCACVVALVACNGAAAPAVPGPDASLSPRDAAVSADVSSGDSALSDSDGGDDSGDWGPDPPETSCDPNASPTVVTCASPPPVCADSRWLVSYPTGSCVAGWCNWQKGHVDCTLAGGTCSAAPIPDAGEGDATVEFFGFGFRGDGGSGCVVQVPPGPDAPQAACDADASIDAAVCPPPPSVCDDSRWVVYYDHGECASGQCSWQKMYRDCGTGGCYKGGCGSLGTAPAAN